MTESRDMVELSEKEEGREGEDRAREEEEEEEEDEEGRREGEERRRRDEEERRRRDEEAEPMDQTDAIENNNHTDTDKVRGAID